MDLLFQPSFSILRAKPTSSVSLRTAGRLHPTHVLGCACRPVGVASRITGSHPSLSSIGFRLLAPASSHSTVTLPLAVVTEPSLLSQPPGHPAPQHRLGCLWAETVGGVGVFPPGPSYSLPTPSHLVLEATESLCPQLGLPPAPSLSSVVAPELSLLEATQWLAEPQSDAGLSDICTSGCRREAKSKA